ncbi:hypothetical protein Godav_014092 [Gossypium davidsonii]|uniref:Uncharacterized protein n=2 Tax=Gossypium TaxID=3633 RepID=A0A7J8RJ16_GOSDV|nr:hypothetical protein [Gossypium davidsonii]MBA0648885.1 hypothetical protein [Gossypium klotzschianum]
MCQLMMSKIQITVVFTTCFSKRGFSSCGYL